MAPSLPAKRKEKGVAQQVQMGHNFTPLSVLPLKAPATSIEKKNENHKTWEGNFLR